MRKRAGTLVFPVLLLAGLASAVLVASGRPAEDVVDPAIPPIPTAPVANATGELFTISTAGSIDTSNPFFQDLGTNGRRCVTCHQPDSAWTVTLLAGRTPYFHNGSAATLSDVVNFYDTRFALKLNDQEKADLVAFLGSL